MLISDNMDIEKVFCRDKEGYSVRIKGIQKQEFITIKTVHASSKKPLKLYKAKLTKLKGEREDSTIIGS